MNQFYRQLTRKALPTTLLALLLAVACAFCGIGFSAWDTAERQLAAADGQYTTIAVRNDKDRSTDGKWWDLIFYESTLKDAPFLMLSQQTARSYPGLLGEDCRGFLAARVPGLPSLSAYERNEFGIPYFDACGNMMTVLAVRCLGVNEEEEQAYAEPTSDFPNVPNLKTYYREFSVEGVVCRKPEQDITPEDLTVALNSCLYTAEGAVPFEEGHTYLLFGYHGGLLPEHGLEVNIHRKEGEPRWIMSDSAHELFWSDHSMLKQAPPNDYFVMPQWAEGLSFTDTGELVERNALFSWQTAEGAEGPYYTLSDGSLPFYVEYEGDWREFLASEEGRVWREEIIPLCQLNYETVNVILTDNIDTMLNFNTGRADILEGRKISGEEYAAGAPVCLVGAAYARKNGLTVGDSIDLDFYAADMDYGVECSLDQPISALLKFEPIWVSQPCTPENRLDIEKEYTIVGIYTAPEFATGWQNFNGNTVFIPKKSIPDAEQYEIPTMPLLYSIILENGKAEEFEAYLESIGFGGLFEYYDQDYNAASAAFAAIAENAQRLFLVGLGALALAGALFLFLSLRRLAPTARGMRLMGIPAKKVWRELWAALAVLVLASAALGALLGWWLYGAVTGRTLAAGMGLRPEALALCAAVQAAALAVLAALAAIPAARPRLLRAGGKKR